MAVVKGQGGVIQIATIAVGHLKSYELEKTVEPVETTAMEDTQKSYIGGLEDGTCSITAFWDSSDAGQEDLRDALDAGTTVTVNIYPSGSTTTGADYYTGDILITSSKVDASKGDGLVGVQFSGMGILEFATVGS